MDVTAAGGDCQDKNIMMIIITSPSCCIRTTCHAYIVVHNGGHSAWQTDNGRRSYGWQHLRWCAVAKYLYKSRVWDKVPQGSTAVLIFKIPEFPSNTIWNKWG